MVRASALRAAGAIRGDEASIVVTFRSGDQTTQREVRVTHRHFPNGGAWSFFICPSCQRRVAILRWYERACCRYCDGLINKSQKGTLRLDRGEAIERLRQRLSKAALNRGRLEASLRRALIFERRQRLTGYPK